MSYRENVEQAAAALKRGEDANWELARLTFESTYQMGDGRMRQTPDRVPMEQWCADVRSASARRFSTTEGIRYKRIWAEAGQPCTGDLPSFAETYAGFEGGAPMATRLANHHVAAALERGLPDAAPEVKRAAFQQLARDPDVIEEAANIGSPTSRAVTEISQRREIIRDEQRERLIESDPIARTIDRQGAALDIEGHCLRFERDCTRFAREISETLTRTGEANEQHLFWVRGTVERARSVLSQLETYMETGQTDIDAFLQDVLGGR